MPPSLEQNNALVNQSVPATQTQILEPSSSLKNDQPKSSAHWKYVAALVILVIIVVVYFLSGHKNDRLIPDTASSTDHCSSHFSVCIPDPSGVWKVTLDNRKDFDLFNETDSIALSFIYSDILDFKDSDPGFTTVSLLDEQKQAYKDVVNGMTRIVTGLSVDTDKTLIVSLVSDRDMSAEKTQEIISNIFSKNK